MDKRDYPNMQIGRAIADGVLIPECHGKLVDIDLLRDQVSHDKREAFSKHQVWLLLSAHNKNIPTILDADEAYKNRLHISEEYKSISKDLVQQKIDKLKQQESRWIPVDERLPNIAGIYMVTRYYPNNVMNPNYLVDACCFDGSNTWYDDNRINHERGYVDNVIAWQENPEPYEVKPQESDGQAN